MFIARFGTVALLSVLCPVGCDAAGPNADATISPAGDTVPQQPAVLVEQASFEYPSTGFAMWEASPPTEPGVRDLSEYTETLEASQYPSTGVGLWHPIPENDYQTQFLIARSNSALLDAGLALRKIGRNEEAITVLEMVLAGTPQTSSPRWNSTENRACIELSELYEERGDLDLALRFAILCRDKYPFSDFCGLVVTSRRLELDVRIASLTKQLSTQPLQCP